MGSLFKKHPLAVMFSVIFHLVLIAFFVFGMDFGEENIQSKPPVNVVKATVIDNSKQQAEVKKLKELEKQKQRKEKKRLDDLKKKRLAEKKKAADLKKKEIDKKALDKKKLEKQKVAEAAKLAKLKAKKALAKKKKADAIKKKAEAKKKKAEAIKKKKQADARKRKERLAKETAAKEQMAREQSLRELAAEEERQMRAQAAVASFTDLIRQKVERNWIQPASDISGLSCVVRVRLIPGGDVIDAQVIKSSGNAFFDRSVELATRKAAPLPLPSDPSMFNYFRTLEFHFRPGG